MAPSLCDVGLIHGRTSVETSEVEATYSAWGASYASEIRAYGYACPERMAALAAELLRARGAGTPGAPRRPSRILDAGCGAGLQAESLRREGVLVPGGELHGVDVSRPLLELCAAAESSHNMKQGYDALHVADLNAPGALAALFPEPDRFDLTLCVGVLTYVHERGVLRELARVTAPGGFVLFTSRCEKAAPWEAEAGTLEEERVWAERRRTDPEPYLPNHPAYADEVKYRAYAFEILPRVDE